MPSEWLVVSSSQSEIGAYEDVELEYGDVVLTFEGVLPVPDVFGKTEFQKIQCTLKL